MLLFFFFKQKTAYEMRISDWSSDVCSSDLPHRAPFTRLVPRLRLSDSAAIQRLSVDRRSQRRVDQPAIDHDRGADDVIAGAAGEVDRGPRHILRDADPPGGNPARPPIGRAHV